MKPAMTANNCSHILISSGVLLVVAISVAILLAACGTDGEQVVAANAEPVKLNLVTWTGSVWGQAERQVIDQFETTQSQIKVETHSQEVSLETLLKQSPPPDLVTVQAEYALNRSIRQRQLANLNDLWTQTELAETLPASLQQLSVFEGNQYYLPMAANWVAIYYNKAVFDQYNLAPPQTWEEFLLVCDTLLAQGVTPLALSYEPWEGMLWFAYLNLRLNGPAFQRELMQGRVQLDDDRVRAVFERWRDLLARGYFGAKPHRLTSGQSVFALIRGDNGELGPQKAAMLLVESWDLNLLPDKFLAEVDFFRFPVIDRALPVAEIAWVYGYSVPSDGDHAPAAIEFLTYMSGMEAQTMLAQHIGSIIVPVNPNVDPALLKPGQAKGRALLRDADDAVLDPVVAMPQIMWAKFESGFRKFMDNPDDIGGVMQRLEEGRQAALKQGLFLE